MARTPFKLKSGNAPLKQNIFKGRKGYKSKSIKSGLESFFRGVQSEISNLASSVSDASKKDVPREIATTVRKKMKPIFGKEARAKARQKRLTKKYYAAGPNVRKQMDKEGYRQTMEEYQNRPPNLK